MTDAFDYLESRDDADELIQEFGSLRAVRRVVASGSPVEPTYTATDYPTYAVKVEFSWRQLQGGNINATDQRWLVAAGPLAAIGEVLPTDKIVIDGAALEIVKVSTLKPAGTVVLFDCQVRV
jgi:hypothetical protein